MKPRPANEGRWHQRVRASAGAGISGCKTHGCFQVSGRGLDCKPRCTAGGKSLRYTLPAMSRTVVVLVTLFAMLWQSVALARIGSTVNVMADLEHAALHWQEEAHHHHQDGSYHLDDSKDSAQHVLCDHLAAVSALLVTSAHDFPSLGSAAPGGQHQRFGSDPTLDGLLRPPRSRA